MTQSLRIFYISSVSSPFACHFSIYFGGHNFQTHGKQNLNSQTTTKNEDKCTNLFSCVFCLALWILSARVFFFFLFAVVCRLLEYLMSTNFPLKPIQRSIQLPLFAYTSCNKVRKPWLLDRRERCDFAELRCDATTTRTNKKRQQHRISCNFYTVSVILQVVLVLHCCVCLSLFHWMLVFDAIPDHHRSANLSKIQFNSVNKERFFPFPIFSEQCVWWNLSVVNRFASHVFLFYTLVIIS